ncbi:MAG TPA: response regulator transcription factor [Candidatus Dormibacteraeota bacterium]|nr:response regulator transcription factor [Candidatus Dormibacteraeota bacterium]
MGRAKVLVVDDERKIRETVTLYLERDGYEVLQAASGEAALEASKPGYADLVVLDLMLPGISGEDVAETLHRTSGVPIIMLTAKSQEEDRIAGLHLGADDYLVKPFSPRELVARVDAVLRRTRGDREPAVESFAGGAITIARQARQVAVDGRRLDLTRTEFDLLALLASRPDRVFTRLELVDRLQGSEYDGFERTIDAHVKNLRHKLGDDRRHPRFVETVIGVGYRFAARPDEDV